MLCSRFGLTLGSGAYRVVLIGELTLVVRRIVQRRPPPGLPISERLTINTDGQHLYAAAKRPSAFGTLN
jgi:hypothetical protein